MIRNTFGSTETRSGVKPVTQTEWNELNNAVINQQYGNIPDIVSVGPNGTKFNPDNFFFPHVAAISGDYQHAIIGWDREESWYPYNDVVNIETPEYRVFCKRVDTNEGAQFKIERFEQIFVDKPVKFTEKNSIIPVKPVNIDNGCIIGYKWALSGQNVNNIEIVTLYDEGRNRFGFENIYRLAFGVKFVPGEIFSEDNQASIYSAEYELSEDGWYFVNEGDVDVGTTLLAPLFEEALLNSPFSGEVAGITLGNGTDAIDNHLVRIPVARYDWNAEQTQLTRCVQLFFGSVGGSSGQYQDIIPDSLITFRHPFKGYVSGTFDDGYSIVIAPDRPNDTYEFKDIITITDPNTELQNHFSIVKDSLEKVAINEDSYVYYDIVLSGDNNWYATLNTTPTWPPNDGPDHLYKVVGYANLSGTSCFWGQEMFECPTEQIPDVRGDFYPTYEDGYVRITSGIVNTFDNVDTTVLNGKFDLSTDQYLWVQVDSTATSTDPSVTVNGTIQTGAAFPGNFVGTPDDFTDGQFNYLLGKVSDGKYIPYHKGSIDIDNTLLMPDMDENFCVRTNTPRMMEFHDNQVTSVGNAALDKLVDAKFVELRVRGGGVYSLIESDQVQFYGLTDAVSGISLAGVVGVDGSAFGEGSFSLSAKILDKEWDHGLVQNHVLTDSTILSVVAGENIRIDWDGSTATINAPPSGETPTAVSAINSIDYNSGNFQFVNDESSPGSTKYYGTDGDGTKGWHPLSQSISAVVEGDDVWIETVNLGGKTRLDHVSPGEAQYWKSYYAAASSGGAVTTELRFDRNGHLIGAPGPVSGFLYVECDGSGEIVNDVQLSANVIQIYGSCYEFIGEANNPTSSIRDGGYEGYSTCVTCLSAGTNEQWLKCSDNTNAAVLTAAHTDVDYAWLCLSGVWVKCYNSTTTFSTSTNPVVLKQCGTTPTSCAQLVGWPASDDFGGTGCNAGAVGDTNDTIRWTHNNGGVGTISIGGGVLSHVATGGGVISQSSVDNYGVLSGNFQLRVTGTVNTSQDSGNTVISPRLWLHSASQYMLACETNNGTAATHPGNWAIATVNGSLVYEADLGAFASMEWVRSGTTLTAYINGTSVWSGTDTTTFTDHYIGSVAVNRGEFDIDYSAYTLNNGAGGEFYIDPTGGSCP